MGAGSDTDDAQLSQLSSLPAVHEVAAGLDAPHPVAVAAARRAIDEARERLLAGTAQRVDVPARAAELARQLATPSLRRVINATGVIVHTNLGRAPLAPAAREALATLATGYSNLELDLAEGARGSRHEHVEELLCELIDAEAAAVVNNGAAAVLLATAALAGPGRAVVVSRAQLVEIGGGFRIPEVVAQSGSELIEVGTTNRTALADYERALADRGDSVAAILRVHQSNFRTVGFVSEVPLQDLCELGVPVIDDIGSGAMLPLQDEPELRRSVATGAALVCCSGDKLLGGPQAGLILGRKSAVDAVRKHPLARAMRIDKLSLAALEATLMLYRDPARARAEIPVLAMLDASDAVLTERASALRDAIGPDRCKLVRAVGRVGGGALPLLELEGPAVALRGDEPPAEVARRLRHADPPVICRIHDGQVLLDPRTLADDELELVARALAG